MRKPNMNLLRKTRAAVLANPAGFNTDEDFTTDIAGFAVRAARGRSRSIDPYSDAKALLRVSAAQLNSLCLAHLWPADLKARLISEPSNMRESRRNARIAAQRIDRFMERGL